MKEITYGCSVTDQKTVGDYNYFLYSRVDKYNLIMQEKTDDTSYKFRVIAPTETIETVWANAESQTYQRPDEFSERIKIYVLDKMREYVGATTRMVKEGWS